MGMFESKPTMEEQLKINKRMINRAVREMDREKAKLEREEQRITTEIKAQAKRNNTTTVKIMAKDLVRTRKHINKFINMRSHLQGVNLRMQTVKSTEAMARALKTTATAMTAVNKELNLPELTAILQEFEEESQKMGISEEVMGEAIDDALDDVGDLEEEDAVVAKILDEIGIDLNAMLNAAPVGATGVANKNAPVALTATGGPKGPQPPPSSSAGAPAPGGDFLQSFEARVNALKK